MNPPFNLEVFGTAADAEYRVTELVAERVASHPKSVLGLATGRSMVAVYAQLISKYRAGRLSFASCTSFNLDEYCDLPEEHKASFSTYMRQHLFDHVDMTQGRWHLPDPAGTVSAADAYERAISAAGGIDLQLLGIGRNGHIGFNEPGSPQESRTRKVVLTASTREANAADFPVGEPVPETAVTMGIATILEARKVLLLATGTAKAEALQRAFSEPVDPDCPASILQRHDDVTVICDEAAASLLRVFS